VYEEEGGKADSTLVNPSTDSDQVHNVWTRIYAGEDFYAWLLSHALDGK
jgi:hypothetical protein